MLFVAAFSLGKFSPGFLLTKGASTDNSARQFQVEAHSIRFETRMRKRKVCAVQVLSGCGPFFFSPLSGSRGTVQILVQESRAS